LRRQVTIDWRWWMDTVVIKGLILDGYLHINSKKRKSASFKCNLGHTHQLV